MGRAAQELQGWRQDPHLRPDDPGLPPSAMDHPALRASQEPRGAGLSGDPRNPQGTLNPMNIDKIQGREGPACQRPRASCDYKTKTNPRSYLAIKKILDPGEKSIGPYIINILCYLLKSSELKALLQTWM